MRFDKKGGKAKENLLPLRMNALWFTYVAIFLYALLPNFGPVLSFLEIAGVSLTWVFLVNAWSIYNDKPIMDERKQKIATNAMAWAFVVVSLLLISAGSIGVDINEELIREITEMGLWAWLIVFSVRNLYQMYGDEF